jgi:hypothetical protein
MAYCFGYVPTRRLKSAVQARVSVWGLIHAGLK